MPTEHEVLEKAERYLQEDVRPKAQMIDLDPEELGRALQGLCDRDLMSLRRPAEFGGPAISEEAFRHFQEQVARVSGSLAFLQTQHQSAGSMIARSDNVDLKADVLPHMGNGQRLIGIGFSQLRRPGPPIMRAEPTAGGYLLNGHVPWVTGHDFYDEFLIGATLPDGRAVFGIVPLRAVEGKIAVSEPMRLCAMESAQTVTVDFSDWTLPNHLVAFVKPEGWIANSDMINIVLQGHFALGCARGGLDVLLSVAEKKDLGFLRSTWKSLDEELEACRAATSRGSLDPGDESPPTQERLQIRAWAIDLAVRCAHAAVAASSGAGNSLSHPAQRIYREALVYTVSAQTTPIMEATLERLRAR